MEVDLTNKDPQKDIGIVEVIDKKYFTPDITDIRVGYECERNNDIRPGLGEGYSKFLFKSIEDIQNTYKYGRKPIRVPYLTKEQIEAEGWTHKEGCLYIMGDEKGHHFYAKYPYTTLKPNALLIMEYTPSVPDEVWSLSCRECRFDGECKDINTFRYICKLLNI